MMDFLTVGGVACAAVLLGAGVLHLIPKLGGTSLAAALCRAPGLDGVITYFTIVPLAGGAVWAGWAGLGAAALGQVAGVLVWGWLHELANLPAARGPRIVKTLNRLTGRFRNHAALWVMAPVVPLFWCIRMVQWTVYPVLRVLVGLPRYRQGEWVTVSRQKFGGLVGHDLIWCLYCDWMTGLWSLGSEMLRNIESFWCPIRFYDGKKCENCKADFPDVDGGWVPANGTMADVTAVLEEKYAGKHRGWFGHRARLTVEGRDQGVPPHSP